MFELNSKWRTKIKRLTRLLDRIAFDFFQLEFGCLEIGIKYIKYQTKH